MKLCRQDSPRYVLYNYKFLVGVKSQLKKDQKRNLKLVSNI